MKNIIQYEWHPVSKPPEKSGKYLVTLKYLTHKTLEIVHYSTNLYKVDKYDFPDKKNIPGWYNYDGEYGYYEQSDIVGWSELPDFYNEEDEKC